MAICMQDVMQGRRKVSAFPQTMQWFTSTLGLPIITYDEASANRPGRVTTVEETSTRDFEKIIVASFPMVSIFQRRMLKLVVMFPFSFFITAGVLRDDSRVIAPKPTA